MKKIVLSIFGIVTALSLTVACGKEISQSTDPAQLGQLAAIIETVSPAEADRLFLEAGGDESSFRKAIEEIMTDPDRVVIFTDAYNSARK